jgi:transposase-like protein
MTTPTPLQDETPKAYRAFQVYVEVGGSVTKVARRLSVTRQNVEKWRSKYGWKQRFNDLRQAEAERRIAAETEAIATVAMATEEERAAAAGRVFSVGDRLITLAERFATRAAHTSLSLRERTLASNTAGKFFAAAKDVVVALASVGGAGRNYDASTAGVQFIVSNVVGAPIQSVEEAEAIIAEAEIEQAHEARASLPCGGWNPNHEDASPLPAVKPYTPPHEHAEPNDGKQDWSAPSRADQIPCDQREGEGRGGCGSVKIYGL